jgi:putative transposase
MDTWHKKLHNCIYCTSEDIDSIGTTDHGYDRFRCYDCRRTFNERSATPFNRLEIPTDIALQAVRWYLRYKLSYRDLSELLFERGFTFTHEAIRGWVLKFTPLISEELRRRRKGKAGESWYIDETYVRVDGKDCYLYRAIDRQGNLVDCMLSKKRDMKAAKRFLRGAKIVTGSKPKRATTDGLPSYPRAIKETLGKRVLHRVNDYLINYTEQSHRPIKQRYYPMRGFGNFKSAAIFCRGFEEVRNFFVPKYKRVFSLKEKRCILASKLFSFNKMIANF